MSILLGFMLLTSCYTYLLLLSFQWNIISFLGSCIQYQYSFVSLLCDRYNLTWIVLGNLININVPFYLTKKWMHRRSQNPLNDADSYSSPWLHILLHRIIILGIIISFSFNSNELQFLLRQKDDKADLNGEIKLNQSNYINHSGNQNFYMHNG
jgi:hypothetical protein